MQKSSQMAREGLRVSKDITDGDRRCQHLWLHLTASPPPPPTALRMLSANVAEASSAAARGRTSAPVAPRTAPRASPPAPPSLTPLLHDAVPCAGSKAFQVAHKLTDDDKGCPKGYASSGTRAYASCVP